MRVAYTLIATMLVAIGTIVPRSLGASPTSSGRVAVVRVYSENVSDIYPIVQYAHQRGWHHGIGVMSAPYQQDMAWLESTLYSGLRGLQGSSSQRYEEIMAKHALVSTPTVLTDNGIGWSFDTKSKLWGMSPHNSTERLYIISTKSLHNPTRAMDQLNPKADAIVIICGPLRDTRILTVAVLGGNTSGLLTSPTSRSIGVISDTDLRGSVMSLLGVKPERLAHHWSISMLEYGEAKLRCERIINLCGINDPLVIWVGVIAGLACILLVCSCLIRPDGHLGLHKLRALCAASLAMLPLASCELGRWIITGTYPGNQAGWLLSGVCVAGGILGCIVTRFRAWAAVKLIMFMTICYVSIVTVLGLEWIHTSVISTYVLTGIRLYGVGNEFMGILVGGCLMMLSISGDKRVAFLLLSMLALIFAAGAWGSNLGGFATCVSAMISLTVYRRTVYRRKLRYGHALAIGLVVALLSIPWPILIDSRMPVPTHMGEAAIRSAMMGQNAIVALLTSKLNLFLRVATLPFGLLTMAGFFVMLWYSTNRIRRNTTPEKVSLYTRWIKTGGFASVPALVFNDSGIVPAVIIMACVMIYALLLFSDGELPTHG